MKNFENCRIFFYLALLSIFSVSSVLADTRFKPVGKYISGAYNLERSSIRFYAIVVTGEFNFQNASRAALRVSDDLHRLNKTHERLWDYNIRTVTLSSGRFLVIGATADNKRTGWMAVNRFGVWVSSSRKEGNTKNDWTRLNWNTYTGDRYYLQIGYHDGGGIIQYQFDKQ